MSARAPLQAALAKIKELEAELEGLRNEMDRLRASHEAQLGALKSQHRTQIETDTTSTRAQIEAARIQSELQSIQIRAGRLQQDRETHVQRLDTLAAEHGEEVDVLLSFSRELAASYYRERAAQEAEALGRAEAEHSVALRTLARKEAEAQTSGQRTFAEMAEIDMGLNLARAEADAAGAEVRDTRARLELLRRKLARAQSAQ